MGEPLSVEHFILLTVLVLVLEEITDPTKPGVESIL
jgi:hypothetical protein